MKAKFKRILSILTLVTMIVTSISFFNGPSIANAQTSKKFTGEEIFRGVIFGEGQVAKSFPQIWTKELLAKSNSKEQKQVIDAIVVEMKSVDSNYFNELKNAIDTKNSLEINNAFEKGGTILDKALESLDAKLTKKEEVQKNDGTGRCVAFYTFYVTAAAVQTAALGISLGVVNNVGAANYVYVYNQYEFWGAPQEGVSNLEKEKFIQEVADQLAS
ncbi:sporulation delaying protein family toxin [Bacillus mycoides]|uniref:sporulation delaying protein family toxin n=1 Tax=Bacillus mycoides TaxID=1405 RepID=UPI003D24C668